MGMQPESMHPSLLSNQFRRERQYPISTIIPGHPATDPELNLSRPRLVGTPGILNVLLGFNVLIAALVTNLSAFHAVVHEPDLDELRPHAIEFCMRVKTQLGLQVGARDEPRTEPELVYGD
jgi:hypothetical protein